MGRRSHILIAVVAASLLAGTPAAAELSARSAAAVDSSVAPAAFPGHNGRIAFAETVPPGRGDAPHYVFTIRPDGTGRKRLTFRSSGTPRWGPFGRRILFSMTDDIWMMRANGTHKRRVVGGRTSDWEAAWAPGGHRFVFTRTRGSSRLFVYSFKTKAAVPITPGSGEFAFAESPAWSPDGRRIVFVRTKHDYSSRDLFTIRPDGTGLRRLTFSPKAFEFSPAWSPGGARLMFNRTADEFDTCEALYTLRADGTDLSRVRVGCRTAHAAWSPNGRKFVAYRWSHRRGLWIMPVDGSPRRFLVSGSGPDWQPRR